MTAHKTILLGLSGGVDSAVAALLLKKEGYNVIGAFMKNFSDTKNKLTNECTWVEDYKMAQKIAALLEIRFIKLDFEKEYTAQVIKPMLADYQRGITPNPDITCNTIVKFPLLWKAAQKLGADYIATGHYARIKKTKKGYELHRARDETKDQSYFLTGLTQKDLAHTLFPIGNLTKKEVRSIAQKNHFPNYARESSKGVCFIGNIPLKQFLSVRIKTKPGKVLDEDNNTIGTHKGANYYTLGERPRPTEGIMFTKGVHAQERFFIIRKDMKKNTITVAPASHINLTKRSLYLKKMHWINEKGNGKILRAQLRIRHLGRFTPATLHYLHNRWQIITQKKSPVVAPGQWAALYRGTQLVCAGEVEK